MRPFINLDVALPPQTEEITEAITDSASAITEKAANADPITWVIVAACLLVIGAVIGIAMIGRKRGAK